MNMRIKLLIVFASLLTLVFALNLGVASADHPGNGVQWTCDEPQGGGTPCLPDDRNSIGPAAENALAPVGRNISGSGLENGFGNENSNAFDAIANNPLCPFHDVTP